MHTILSTLLCSCAVASFARAQVLEFDGPATLAFEQELDPGIPADDVARALAVAGSTIYATGYSGAQYRNLRIAAWDSSSGALLWEQILGSAGPASPSTQGLGILVAPGNGPVFVRGTYNLPGSPWTLAAVAAFERNTGALLWVRELQALQGNPGGFVYSEQATGFVLSPAGDRLYVAYGADPDMQGAFPAGAPSYSAHLLALDAANGTTLYDQPIGLQGARGLVLSADGSRAFVLGSNYSGSVYTTILSSSRVDCRSTGDGAPLWSMGIESNLPGLTGAREGALNGDGSLLFVAGGNGSKQLAALSTTNGVIQWSRGAQGLVAWKLAAPGGAPLLAGTLGGSLWVERFDALGNSLWSSTGGPVARVRGLSVVGSRAIAASEVPNPTAFHSYVGIAGFDLVSGQGLWTASIGAQAGFPSLAGDLVPLGADRFGLCGGFWSSLAAQQFALEVRQANDGVLLLEETLDATAPGEDSLVESALSPDGQRLYSLARSTGGSPLARSFVHALDLQAGTTLFDHTLVLAAQSNVNPARILPDPAGGLVFVGGADGDYAQHLTLALDATSGAEVWRQSADDWPGNAESVIALGAHGASSSLITATFTGTAYRMRGLDKQSGQVLWTLDSASGSLNQLPTVVFSKDGSIAYLLGTTLGTFGALTDPFVMAIQAQTGQLLWTQAYDWSAAVESWDHDDGIDAVLSPDGQFLYLVGYTTADSAYTDAYLFIKVATATGAALWTTVEPALPGLRPLVKAAGLSPDGQHLFGLAAEVPVTPGGSWYYGAVSLDAVSGQTQWHTLSMSSNNSDPRDLAVALDGSKLYLIGRLGVGGASTQAALIALDAKLGATVWSAVLNTPSAGYEEGRSLLLDGGGERLYLASRAIGSSGTMDVFIDGIDLPRLTAFPQSIPLATGGIQHFDLSGGSALGGQVAWLLGSLSGTTPGLALPIGTLPLNPDAYFDLTLLSPNQPPLAGTLSLLSPTGHTEATLSLPAGTAPALAGLTAQHAWVSIQGSVLTAISNPVPLALQP